MNPQRRAWLLALGAGAAQAGAGQAGAGQASAAKANATQTGPPNSSPMASPAPSPPGPPPDDDAVSPTRALRFPHDHGAHLQARIEWWYATGWLRQGKAPLIGFQVTFFRSRTGVAQGLAGRLAPRQLLFAHAAITELKPGGHRHAQRLSRWSGQTLDSGPLAQRGDTGLRLGAWQLQRQGDAGGPLAGAYQALIAAPEAGFRLSLHMRPTQGVLLQGQAGHSRKGPPPHASHYYSLPQLQTQASLVLDGRELQLPGRAWLDHEWSDSLMPPQATGWDWIGINLHDGSALTAFVLRGANGSAVFAGGSHRAAAEAHARAFAADDVTFTPLRHWRSPASGASYPVRWRIATPAGQFELEALLDAQELDSRASTGAIYWEGLAELRDASGRPLGLGYLEMTGRAAPLRLG